MSDVVFKADTHQYFRGSRELASVTRVLKSIWPVKPSFEKADPAVLENARERGVEVDALLGRYATGSLDKIPAGTREDAKELFLKAKPWIDAARQAGPIKSQVILANDSVAGMCDFVVAGPVIADLKATYDVEPYYQLQLGIYALLYEHQFGVAVEGLGIIHVTKRFAQPRWLPLDVDECKRDAKLILDVWDMAQRRIASRG